jgi:hypothetical protein
LAATFIPTRTTPTSATASVTLAVGTAVCGSSASSIALTGQGTAGAISVSGDLDFGNTPCGDAGTAQQITLHNSGNGTFTYTATLGQGLSSPFVLSNAQGSVDAGASQVITVTPLPIPTSVAAVPGSFGDTVSIVSNIPNDTTHLVNLTQGALGAIIGFDTSVIAFGGVPLNTTQGTGFHVINSGNAPANVTLSVDAGVFSVTPTAQTLVAGGSNLAASAGFSPVDTTFQAALLTAAVASSDVLCQPLPSAIALSGTGLNGGVSISPGSLDFGLVSCGTDAGPQSFALSNSGNASLNWTAVLGLSPSPFALSCNPSSGCASDAGVLYGSLAPDAGVAIVATPFAVPSQASTAANGFGDAVTVTTNVINDTLHVLPLTQTAYGAILAFNPTNLDFGIVPVGQSLGSTFQVQNSGNAPANVTFGVDDSLFSVAQSAVTVIPGGTSTPNLTATFTPDAGAFEIANLWLDAGATDVYCAPIPTPMTLQGTGTSGTVAYEPTSLSFGNASYVECGTQAPFQNITFINFGNASYNVFLDAGQAPGYTFALSPSTGVVAPDGGSLTITVTPPPVPAITPIPTSYDGTLWVTTNAALDTPHAIPLYQEASGAIISFNPALPNPINFGNVPVTEQYLYPIAIDNTGNESATINFINISDPTFSFDQGQVVPGSGGGGVDSFINPNAYFLPTAVTSYSATATMQIVGTLCAAPPATGLSMAGVGVPTPVITENPTSLLFGKVGCGLQAAPQILTFSNHSVNDWTITLPTLTYYTFSTPGGSLTVPAGGTLQVTVAPKAISSASPLTNGYYNQTATFALAGSGGGVQSVSVPLYETAQGAILNFAPGTIGLGSNKPTVNFKLSNTGNMSAAFTLSLSYSGTATLVLGATSGTVTPAKGFKDTLTGTNFPASTQHGTLSVITSTPLCQSSGSVTLNVKK